MVKAKQWAIRLKNKKVRLKSRLTRANTGSLAGCDGELSSSANKSLAAEIQISI